MQCFNFLLPHSFRVDFKANEMHGLVIGETSGMNVNLMVSIISCFNYALGVLLMRMDMECSQDSSSFELLLCIEIMTGPCQISLAPFLSAEFFSTSSLQHEFCYSKMELSMVLYAFQSRVMVELERALKENTQCRSPLMNGLYPQEEVMMVCCVRKEIGNDQNHVKNDFTVVEPLLNANTSIF